MRGVGLETGRRLLSRKAPPTWPRPLNVRLDPNFHSFEWVVAGSCCLGVVPVVGYCIAFIDAGDVVKYHVLLPRRPFLISWNPSSCTAVIQSFQFARLHDVSHHVTLDVRMPVSSCFPSLFRLGAVATHELFRGLLACGFLTLWVIDYVLLPYHRVAPFRRLALPVGLCFEIPSCGRGVR